MLPSTENYMEMIQGFEIAQASTVVHELDFENMRFTGRLISGKAALKQAIILILNCERYEYVIHTWNHGVELVRLFGKPKYFVYPELERRITEALMQDSRVNKVDKFTFEAGEKNSVHINFTVHSIYGELEMEYDV